MYSREKLCLHVHVSGDTSDCPIVCAHPPSLSHVDMASQSTQPPVTNPAPQELTNNDLALLLDTLNSVATKCFALGLQLGLDDVQLGQIEYDHKRCKDQLRVIISARLRQVSPLTWHDIIRALRADSVHENGLASEIENRYIHHLPPPASVAPQANTASLAASSLLQSSLPASQCGRSSPVQGDHSLPHSVMHPLSQTHVDNEHTLHFAQVMAPTTRHITPPHPIFPHTTTPSSVHHTTHVLSSSQHSRPIPQLTSQPLGVQPRACARPGGIPHPSYIFSHVQMPQHQTSHPNATQLQYHPPLPRSSSVPPLQEGATGGQWNPQPHRPPSTQAQSSSANDRKVMSQLFIDYVKTIYKESEVERDMRVVKWPPTPSTVYINLACINRKSISGKSREYAEITEAMVRDGNVDVIDTTKGPIEFAEIAKGISIPSGKVAHSEQKRLILVEGAPGVGKSTFALEFCRRWERGEIAQQYQLVLLLRLRDESIRNAKSMRDLIHHPSESVSQAVSEELKLSHNFHALIILEGFDELPDHCRNAQSIFFQLIAGKLLPLATVLVTSRPWATQRIRFSYEYHIYQHIEILVIK